jgi:hypothetical protein
LHSTVLSDLCCLKAFFVRVRDLRRGAQCQKTASHMDVIRGFSFVSVDSPQHVVTFLTRTHIHTPRQNRSAARLHDIFCGRRCGRIRWHRLNSPAQAHRDCAADTCG